MTDKDRDRTDEAAAEGKAAGRQQANCVVWYGVGCLGNLIGVGVAALVVPGPRIEVLLGKTPRYVTAYTGAYRSERRSRQVVYASLGCLTAALGVAGLALACANTEINCGDNLDCGFENSNCGGSDNTCGSFSERQD